MPQLHPRPVGPKGYDEIWDRVAGPSGTPLHYDRQGRPISLRQWVRIAESPRGRFVKSTNVGPFRVSTVWIGLDHGFGSGVPLIFETMVFEQQRRAARWDGVLFLYHFDAMEICRRYSTERGALRGHQLVVSEVRRRRKTIAGPDALPPRVRRGRSRARHPARRSG